MTPASASGVNMIYVVGSASNSVSIIDPFSGTVQRTLSTITSPSSIVVNSAGTYLYVVGKTQVQVFDINTYNVIATIDLPGSGSSDIVMNADGTLAYVSLYDSNLVAVIDTTTNTIKTTIPVGVNPAYMVYNSKNNKVVVSNFNNNGASNVSIISCTTNTVVATVPVDAGPYALASQHSGDNIYVPCIAGNDVKVISLVSNAVTSTIDTGGNPVSVVISNADDKGYIVNAGLNKIQSFTTSNNVLGTQSCTPGYLIAISSDDSLLYMSAQTNGSVYVMPTSTMVISGNITTPLSYIHRISNLYVNPSTANPPIQVSFKLTYGPVILNNTTVTLFDVATGNMAGMDQTDTQGIVVFSGVIPGKMYRVIAPSFNSTVQVQATDLLYYIDVKAGTIVASGQYVSTVHVCQLTITHWFGTSPETYMNVQLFVDDYSYVGGITDSNGRVSLLVYSNILYKVWIYNTTQGVNVTRYMDLSGTTYTIDITGQGSWLKYPLGDSATNSTVSGVTNNPDVDIVSNATGYYNGVNSNIGVNYTDAGLSTTSLDISIYTPNTTGPMLPNIFVANQHYDSYNNPINYVYSVSGDPAGKTYIVYVNATYSSQGGVKIIKRIYTINYPSPMIMIPGMPLGWYTWLSFAILIVLGLIVGKFDVANGAISISAVASVLFAIGWFWGISFAYMCLALGIAWTVSIAAKFMESERGGLI